MVLHIPRNVISIPALITLNSQHGQRKMYSTIKMEDHFDPHSTSRLQMRESFKEVNWKTVKLHIIMTTIRFLNI